MKFLVIRFSSIGDIVLASPVLRCLKKQVITAEVHFLTRSRFKMVTEANPYVDKFFYFDEKLGSVLDELREERYDYVIDLHNNFRSNRVKRSLGVKSYTIDKLNFEKFLLTKLRINIMPRRHITHRSLDTVAAFGVKDDGGGLDYFIAEKDRVNEADIPAAHLSGYIAIVIGASYKTKKLPVEKLRLLCDKLHHPVILLGGREDEADGARIAEADPVKIYNACGKFNLSESADLVRRARLVISHDTGLQYIACAFNKTVLALWGSTSPRLDVEPYYSVPFLKSLTELPYENIIRMPELGCQPCSKYGNKKCPLGHFKCMRQMDIDYIVDRVNYRLGR
jgi:ADP-heptose:LPS heptosyltransferase